MGTLSLTVALGDADAYGARSFLSEFRGQVLGPLSLAPAGAAVVVLTFVVENDRPETWLPLGLFSALAALVLWARRFGDSATSLCLTVGMTLALTVTAFVYPWTAVACLFGPLVAIATVLLGTRHGLFSAAFDTLIVVALYLLWGVIARDVAVVAVALVWTTALLSWISTHPVYTALAWAWTSYEDGLRKTEELRDRQGELGRLSKSLRETCVKLEVLNQELEKARLAAEEARRLKDEFAATVSHELRTPLNLVIGFSEMMVLSPADSYDEPLPPGYRSDVEAIYRNACHISDLIDDILDLSKIDAHRMALHKETVALEAVVAGAVNSTASLFRDKKLRLLVDLPPGIPPLHVDPTRIRQVLINLLANAVRYTEEGQVTVGASVVDGREVVLSVSDTGVGMTPQEVELIFEPFNQAGDVVRQKAGKGLGLAISKRFVELHGGSMWAESRPSEGSSFCFSLPLDGQVVLPAGAPRWEAWMAAREAARESVVLVLDPEGEAAHVFERYLDGFRVVRATDLDQARRVARDEPIEALIVVGSSPPALPPDGQLDGDGQIGGDGRLAGTGRPAGARSDGEQGGPKPLGEALALPGIPTISVPLQRSWAGAAELGVSDYLVKPVSSEQISSALRRRRGRVKDVLIVDDDPDMLRLLERMVRAIRPRCRISLASDGVEGLRLLRAERPDVVFLDLLMPNMDGYAVLDAIRGDGTLERTRVVVITARGRERETLTTPSVGLHLQRELTVGQAMRWLQSNLDALRAARLAGSAPAPTAGPFG